MYPSWFDSITRPPSCTTYRLPLTVSFSVHPSRIADSRLDLFDVDTAVTAYAKLVEPPFGFLLESVVGGDQWARYSFLGTRPSGAWRLREGKVSWWTPEGGWKDTTASDPLRDLDERLRARRPAEVAGLPRLWGGAVGYFAYDVVRQIERLPYAPPDNLALPDALLLFTDVVLAIDNPKGRALAIGALPGSDRFMRSIVDDDIVRKP